MSLPEKPHQPPKPRPPDESPAQPDLEFVGAPTEYADAQEAPEWVQLAAKALFFLPAAVVTATTIPIIVIGMLLVFMAACIVLFAFL